MRLISDRSAPKQGFLGIIGENEAPLVHLPIKVTIDTGNLGGPSAGLAFTLEIYDSLTGRKLSHGRFVAVHVVAGDIERREPGGRHGGVRSRGIVRRISETAVR